MNGVALDYESLALRPMYVTEARAWIGPVHRHSGPVVSALFAVAVEDGSGTIRGVAIVGRPKTRAYDDGRTGEVVRVGTDGVRNGCSMLYGSCNAAMKALGYRRAYTYTLAEEPGSSLRACGWELDEELPARASWDTPSRRRVQNDLFGDARRPPGPKKRWVKFFDPTLRDSWLKTRPPIPGCAQR